MQLIIQGSNGNKGRYDKGYVYFARDITSGLVKIGHTTDPAKRLKNLANQLPSDIELIHIVHVNERLRAERSFQRYYSDKNIKTEWYALTEEDIKWLKAGYYPPVVKECLISEVSVGLFNLETRKRAE